MTFDPFETSVDQSQPVELYQIIVGNEPFRWTSAEDEQVVGGLTYEAVSTERTRIGQGREERQATLEITVPGSFNFVRNYIGNVPGHDADNTRCPKCNELLIERHGFTVTRYELKDGKCPNCGEKINVVGEH